MLIWAMPPVDVEAQWSRFQERRRGEFRTAGTAAPEGWRRTG